MPFIQERLVGTLNAGVTRPRLPFPWSPTDYGADLVAWYNPAGKTAGTVTAYPDSGPAHNDIATITGTPAFSSTALNGYPGVVFDGSSRLRSAATISIGTSPVTLLFNGAALGTGGSAQYFCDGAASNGLAFGRSITNNYWFIRRTGAAASLTSSAGQDAAPHAFAAVFNGASSLLYVDGVQKASGDAGSSSPGTSVVLGSNGAGSTMLNGVIGDYVLIKRALTADEISNATAWLRGRMGISPF